MLKLAILFLFVFYFWNAFSQNVIEGKIYDEFLKSEVTYAKVRVQNTNKGVLTNENGDFQLACNPTDSLIISHPLYERLTVESGYFNNNDTLFVNQGFQEIEEVVAIGLKNNGWIDLFREARKKLINAKEFDSKAYFSIESSADNIPKELIEAYYNTSVNSNGPNKLDLKNGRIGLSESGGEYFVSLGTTQILSDYKLLKSTEARLPLNPFQLSKRKLKKYYKIELSSVENGLQKFHLKPIESVAKRQLFEAFVWIKKSDTSIRRIELSKSELKVLPFVEINPGDSIDSVNFHLTYNFDNEDSEGRLQGIEFNYNFLYSSKSATRKINSSGVLMFYDVDDLFALPKFECSNSMLSDYDKIVSQPYNDFFWRHNKLMLLSENEQRYTEYFKENGVLLNFSDLIEINPIFKNRIIHWNEKRIFLNQINGDNGYGVRVSTLYDYHNLLTLSDHYQLEACIFLDQNRDGDSTHFILKTMINVEESFYHLKKNKNTVCMVNMYFDLVEFHKQSLESILGERSWTVSQVDSIYNETQSELDESLNKFLKGVEHGENDTKIGLYANYLEEKLSIDNSLLIESEEMKLEINQIQIEAKDEAISRYNYGSALMKIGKFEKALPILLEAVEIGDDHPWAFYNIGMCYFELGKNELGCAYFSMSETLGEKLEKEIKVKCSSSE